MRESSIEYRLFNRILHWTPYHMSLNKHSYLPACALFQLGESSNSIPSLSEEAVTLTVLVSPCLTKWISSARKGLCCHRLLFLDILDTVSRPTWSALLEYDLESYIVELSKFGSKTSVNWFNLVDTKLWEFMWNPIICMFLPKFSIVDRPKISKMGW